MKISEQSFFMEGTLRICGSLEIEKALKSAFDFISEHIPADEIYLHYYRRETGSTRIFAMADREKGRLMNQVISWSEKKKKLLESDTFPFNLIANQADQHPLFGEVVEAMGWKKTSFILVRLEVENQWIGAVTLWAKGWNRFTEERMKLFLLLKRPFTIALSNVRQYQDLLGVKNVLADDRNYLQKELQRNLGNEVVGADFGLRNVMEMVRQVAPLSSPVLLRGETGTGKEVIANAIHNLSDRREGPFIKVNCGAIPESLMDSELFGHEKGAFTGALKKSRGRFERAHGGTLFLDEIGELTQNAQVRMLRVIQEKTIERVGGSEPVSVNIRIIAATHRNLESMIREKRFREDLYFRLQVFPIPIPPLRERTADIPALVLHFLAKKTREFGFSRIPDIASGALDLLSQYHWPGNVRELENLVERSLILDPKGPIQFKDLSVRQSKQPVDTEVICADGSLTLDQINARHIRRILKMTSGKIAGKNGAAEILGVNVSTLRHKMRKLDIPFGRNNTAEKRDSPGF
jgi:formate hydrogenlyase transcriptional activator